jgi:tRNA(Ile)-lysidine synthetase-like protein
LNTYINLYEEREFFDEKIENFKRENLKFAVGIFALKLSGKTEVLRVLSEILNVEIKPLRQIFHLKNLGRFDIAGWKLYRYNDYIIGIRKKLTLEDLNLRFVGEGKVRFRREGEIVDGKKLKEIFYQKRIPGFLRDIYPLVERDGKIVWVPFVFGEDAGRFEKIDAEREDFFEVLKFVGIL